MFMSSSILISSHVINTINSLPVEERVAVSAALVGEMILGKTPSDDSFSPKESLLYSIIRQYVRQDSARYANEHFS